MDLITIPDDIRTENTNQQTTYDPADADINDIASYEFLHGNDVGGWEDYGDEEIISQKFYEVRDELDDVSPSKIVNVSVSKKPVVIVGGGSAEVLSDVAKEFDGLENMRVMAAGSAAFRLNREAQEKDGYPVLDRADEVVLNGVDADTPANEEYYQKVALALEKHPTTDVYLSSTNSATAFEALSQAGKRRDYYRVEAANPHVEPDADAMTVGLGSTAPPAALIIAMLEGNEDFHFVGVDGAIAQPIPEEDADSFNEAAAKLAEPDRYPDYDIGNPKWAKIEEGNKLLVLVNGMQAMIPSGQWYQLQELRTLVEWGRENGMSFTFHGDENSLSSLVLEQGHDATLIADMRTDANLTSGSKLRIGFGSKIKGLKVAEAAPAALIEGPNGTEYNGS